MFQDFIKIADRSFIVGYLTPVILFITSTSILIDNFFQNILSYNLTAGMQNLSSNLINDQTTVNATGSSGLVEVLWNLSALILLAWFISIILVINNNSLIQLIEGYGLLARTHLLSFQLKKFDKINKELKEIKLKYKNEQKNFGAASKETQNKYMDLLLISKNNFPPKREEVLATTFGNIIRSAETYPREMYGLDAISVWGRIIEIVPKEHRESLRNDKANVDFSVNIWFLTLAAIFEYIVFAVVTGSLRAFWLLFAILVLHLLSYNLAEKSARIWGENIKTVFDLYRHDLIAKMGISGPLNLDDERECWGNISKSFTYWKKLK